MLLHHMWLQGFDEAPVSRAVIEARSWGSQFEHKYWDEASVKALVQVHYPDWLHFYSRIPTLIIKCDISRAFVLHRYGGVYADLDILPSAQHGEVVDSLQPLLRDKVVAMGQTVLGLHLANNCWMACRPRHPFWTENYLPYARKYLQDGGSSWDVFMGIMLPNYHVFATGGPLAMMRASPARVHTLSLKLSNSLCVHPPMQSNWIQYKVTRRHLIFAIILALLACFAVLNLTFILLRSGS